MKVTVIGCGNSGLIHAAVMLQAGIRVGLLKSSNVVNNNFFDNASAKGSYNVIDKTRGGIEFIAKPEFFTRDVKMAVEFADIIFVMTTTLQHEGVAKIIEPYVRDGQIIILVPNYIRSLIFRNFIKKKIIYSEWETTAYNGRIVDNEHVNISFFNPRNAISVSPTNKSEEVLSILSGFFNNTRYLRQNILESAFHNPNMIVHTIGVLFSAARIEHSEGEFWMYREAFTPSIIKVIEEFDKTKNSILNSFGCDSLNYFEAAKWRNEENLSINAMDVFRGFANSSNKGPGQLYHRYLLEDVPMGLCLFSSIARVVGIKTEISDSIISLTSVLLGEDFWKYGRTIEKVLVKDKVIKKDIEYAIR